MDSLHLCISKIWTVTTTSLATAYKTWIQLGAFV